ncbi:MAG: hypothetical protein ACRDTF_04140, partial [Pseudonocardiaceae bacterium]
QVAQAGVPVWSDKACSASEPPYVSSQGGVRRPNSWLRMAVRATGHPTHCAILKRPWLVVCVRRMAIRAGLMAWRVLALAAVRNSGVFV